MRVRSLVGSGAVAAALIVGPVATASAEVSEPAGGGSLPTELTCENVFDALEDNSPEWADEGIDQVEDWCEMITGEED